MKKVYLLFVALIMLFLSGCEAGKSDIVSGNYVMEMQEKDDSTVSPYLYIDTDDNAFLFFYDSLSSYANVGSFTVEKGVLKAVTNDEKYTYCFSIEKDGTLKFIKDASSEIKVVDERFVPEIKDGTVFVPEESQ
jgi:hypothetical protein